VDFFAGDKQETIRLYEQILSDANDYGIQVIFHGCTLPRGWERMYPNYCSSEAVLASENLVFNQHFDDMEGFNATLHPFCRNAVGSMEFGGTVLQRRLNRNNNGGTTRKVSDVFELATAIAFQSSVQNFALTPMNLDETVTPKFEIDFMRQVPTEWDETRLIDGYPGQYIILARRSGSRWYVVAMNAQQKPLKVNVQVPMLQGKQVTQLSDGKDGLSPASSQITLDRRGTFKTEIPAQCAVVLY
ncbi:MAG: glycoside hydrolase family 97 catalytic domain-containing protein, partial [Bacteroidaceae bacterium]|nr:glycoside hydrolase family 97 catalytic domain-containing protein [Bacteroidaceae bacterium]